MSSLQQNWRRKQNRFCLEARGVGGDGGGGWQGGEMAQTMYAHVNKFIKKKKIGSKRGKKKKALPLNIKKGKKKKKPYL
jgi:hypothetical protein